MEGTVGLFALLGFVYVPLGRHTGLEHARAVLSTPAATAAIDDLASSVLALRQRATDFIAGPEARLGPRRPTEQPPGTTAETTPPDQLTPRRFGVGAPKQHQPEPVRPGAPKLK